MYSNITTESHTLHVPTSFYCTYNLSLTELSPKPMTCVVKSFWFLHSLNHLDLCFMRFDTKCETLIILLGTVE